MPGKYRSLKSHFCYREKQKGEGDTCENLEDNVENMEEKVTKYQANDSDQSDNEEVDVLKEYDLDNYDEDGEGTNSNYVV